MGPLAEAGVYNLKSLTALAGPATEVFAADAVAVPVRDAGGQRIERPDPDVSHVIVRHVDGALSSVTSGQAVQRYRRPGLELYGTEGTANLLGDDWDPTGLEYEEEPRCRLDLHRPDRRHLVVGRRSP